VLQCCGSGMFIPDHGSWFLPIPDPGSLILDSGFKKSNKREWRKKLFCSHKIHKGESYFIFEILNKIVCQFSKNYRTFTKIIVTKLSKIWDMGSKIQKKPILDHRSDPDIIWLRNWIFLKPLVRPIDSPHGAGRETRSSELPCSIALEVQHGAMLAYPW
jgi:hypothetical protein